MSSNLEKLNGEKLAETARNAGKAAGNGGVMALAEVVAELCRRLDTTEKRLKKVEERNSEIRGRLRVLEDVITGVVPAQTLKSLLDELKQNMSSVDINFDLGYSNGIERLEKILARMSGQ